MRFHRTAGREGAFDRGQIARMELRQAGGKGDSMTSTPDMQHEIRRALERGRHIQSQVRDITLKALAHGELDGAGMRKVTREALETVREAAAVHGERAKDLMREAIDGVDQALAHAAQALKLSLEEAGGRADKFSRKDLAKARESLQDLEKLFVDTLRESARAGRGAAGSMFEDLAKHAQASGTAVGRQLKDMAPLSGRLADAGREQFVAGLRGAAASGAAMARIASGVLAGLADSLAEKSRPKDR
jgi:hypothetical protein